jgi:ribonuclease D
MSEKVQFAYIVDAGQLEEFCRKARGSQLIGFDTEFVSEDRYLPELCLLQICADDELAIVDPLSCSDLSAFWDLVTDQSAGHTTVVHAAREEFRFCVNASGKRPARLVDTQIAAGLTGMEFPASYSNLVSRFAGQTLAKHETRTNWRHRPLNDAQLQYAIKDVLYLRPVFNEIRRLLGESGREGWLWQEMSRQQDDLEQDQQSERWDRLPGAATLQPQQLAVVRELWRWREATAAKLDTPSRRLLRDDLLIELSRRGLSNRSGIRSIRGMEYGRVQKFLPEIAAVIERSTGIPKSEWPKRPRKARVPNLGLLGQFLSTALGVICRDATVAPNLVASTEELRLVAAWRLGMIRLDQVPRLFTGWRCELIGEKLDEILDGTCSIRVVDPKADQPLAITR